MDSYLGLPLFAVWRNQESCVTSPSKVTEQELTLHLFQPFKVEYIDIKKEKNARNARCLQIPEFTLAMVDVGGGDRLLA
ncbi:MAG: hypothetical protein WCG50_10820 [Rhodoferax sp.]|uniref:hypothetical protein n=1 Tax=Rhodoferax sp. TaxID=50421 RepID=UPI003017B912